DWTYREGKFTFGDLMRHLASIERWMFAENVAGRPSIYPGHGRELGDGYDAIVDYMRGMHTEAMEIFGALSDADLDRKCVTPGGADARVSQGMPPRPETEPPPPAQAHPSPRKPAPPPPPVVGAKGGGGRGAFGPVTAGDPRRCMGRSDRTASRP